MSRSAVSCASMQRLRESPCPCRCHADYTEAEAWREVSRRIENGMGLWHSGLCTVIGEMVSSDERATAAIEHRMQERLLRALRGRVYLLKPWRHELRMRWCAYFADQAECDPYLAPESRWQAWFGELIGPWLPRMYRRGV